MRFKKIKSKCMMCSHFCEMLMIVYIRKRGLKSITTTTLMVASNCSRILSNLSFLQYTSEYWCFFIIHTCFSYRARKNISYVWIGSPTCVSVGAGRSWRPVLKDSGCRGPEKRTSTPVGRLTLRGVSGGLTHVKILLHTNTYLVWI